MKPLAGRGSAPDSSAPRSHRIDAPTLAGVRTLSSEGPDMAEGEVARIAELVAFGQAVAHRVRGPLAAIRNAADLVARYSHDPSHPAFVEALRILRDEATSASRVVGELGDNPLARTPRPRPVDLGGVLRSSLFGAGIAFFEVEPSDAPTSFLTKVEGRVGVAIEPEVVVVADDRDLAVIVKALVRNALEADDEGLVRVTVRTSPGAAHVVVEDEGPGVDPALADTLFVPRVSARGSGLGLGLATARALARRAGGDVVRVREGGRGERFELRLPLADVAAR
ncbi:MAG: HAMP domain-containing sensor histidine kinase [Polyangiaceae bacterium]